MERARRRCSPCRSAIPSPPRSSPSRPGGWSAGSRSGSPRASAPSPAAPTASARNVEFPTPRRLVGDAVAAVSGVDPDADPWLPERAVWPLLEIVDEALGEPWLRALAEHLGDGDGSARRAATPGCGTSPTSSTATRCIGRSWCARGPRRGRRDPRRRRLAGRAWRRLRERIPVPGPAERIEGACARLRDEPGLVELPARLVPVRPHAAARRPPRRPRRARRPSRRPPARPAPVAGPVGTDRRTRRDPPRDGPDEGARP